MERVLLPNPIGGRIRAIASKSQAHRLLICGALADRETVIHCAETSADIDATARCLCALGAEIYYAPGQYHVTPIKTVKQSPLLDCGESGSTLRFLLPVAAALGANATFFMHGRLPKRPLSPLWEELEAHGCKISRPTENTLLCEGRMQGGSFRLAGNISSQFISGLLFALPLVEENSDVMLTTALESAGYVDMTLAALKEFGICPEPLDRGWRMEARRGYTARESYIVEGDWSNAAFWLCGGAISKPVAVSGLIQNSRQGDRKILSLLERFGASVSWSGGTVTVCPAPLTAIEIDAREIPDLVPILALVASCARGTSRIYGAERLRIKESDRLQSVAQTLNALGGQVEITSDGLLVTGKKLRGGTVDSFNDHRIAMLTAIASAVCTEGVSLSGAEAVKKSYPRFWEDFEQMSDAK